MPPTKTWKAKEAQGASELNPGAGRRTPLSGSNSGHNTSADAINLNGLYVEAKHRKIHSVLTLLRDTMVQAKAERKIPIVRLTQHLMRGAAYLIHSAYLDDVLKTLCINRCVSPFESSCDFCGGKTFTEGPEQCMDRGDRDTSSYLVRRCATCGFPIRYSKRTIDPEGEDLLFPPDNQLPDFNPRT